MLRIKKKKKEEKKTVLNEQELVELREGIKTVQHYEQKLNISIMDKQKTNDLLTKIQEKINIKHEISIEERLQRLEKTISKIANKKE
ncbi:MAG: hypothetical protein KGY67_00395 [Candidatus Thermoplasmatota archaeon]|nr:hypothetical protein [Candidatus Thermoplasmatota archaeon]